MMGPLSDHGSESGFRTVTAAELGPLLVQGARVLDVRTPEEYDRLGHIPGALLLPVHLIASGPAVVPEDGKPLVVCCEHGIRSLYAADVLARAGVVNVFNLAGGMAAWAGPREHGPGMMAGPSSWLRASVDLLPRHGQALDVACGRGRHALLLAAAGLTVHAIDRDPVRIAALGAAAARLGLPVRAEVADLEQGRVGLGDEVYDLVLVVHYLHRPLFPALERALAPGGLLLYETFTTAQAARGKPTNPDFLLQPGELRERLGALQIVREREGEFDGSMIAGVAARKR